MNQHLNSIGLNAISINLGSVLQGTAVVLCWLLSLVLAFAAIEHLNSPWMFLNTVFRYRLVQGYMAVYLAGALPILQFAIAAMMMANYGRRLALLVAIGLFAIFACAQTWALVSGLDISCGCFGNLSGTVSQKTIGLDLMLLFLAVFCLSVITFSKTENSNA